jgi:hypothetical protein
MASEPDERYEHQLGHKVTFTAWKRLRQILRDLEARELRVDFCSLCDVMIKLASLDDLAPHFPPLGTKRKRPPKS